MGRELQFYLRDDVSQCTTGKKDTVTKRAPEEAEEIAM